MVLVLDERATNTLSFYPIQRAFSKMGPKASFGPEDPEKLVTPPQQKSSRESNG